MNKLMVLYGDNCLCYRTKCDGVFPAFNALMEMLESIDVNMDEMQWDELILCDSYGQYIDHENREDCL